MTLRIKSLTPKMFSLRKDFTFKCCALHKFVNRLPVIVVMKMGFYRFRRFNIDSIDYILLRRIPERVDFSGHSRVCNNTVTCEPDVPYYTGKYRKVCPVVPANVFGTLKYVPFFALFKTKLNLVKRNLLNFGST